jgi:nicotinate phosphoribosyltransferase
MPRSLYVTESNAVLSTDLYEITMSAAYWANQMNNSATFELYFRRLPVRRSYVVTAGLEQAIEFICNLRFSSEHTEWLKNLPQFKNMDPRFFDFLLNLRFTGDVWAVPEGTPVFPLEPMLQIRAPLIEAQILETYLLSTINMQSLIATKAERIVRAAGGRGVIDFGMRRAHGPQAGLLAARASYIGGCQGTSNVLAGHLAGIPVYGTAAHSFSMAFPTEKEAFEAYLRVFPDNTVLLIDTYDTLEAARKVKQLPGSVSAVRIDSGDLLTLSREVRKILDEDNLAAVKIFASGDLNEYKIEDLLSRGAPIDLFGVGTELVTSYDDPALSGVYKMVETTIDGKNLPTAKISPGKVSYPGRKQIYRYVQNSYYSHDVICHADEPPQTGGIPLLQQYIRNGQLVKDLPAISQLRQYCKAECDYLPPAFHRLSAVEDYPVVFSQRLQQQLADTEERNS